VYRDGIRVLKGEIPVFVLHDVSSEWMERAARFLADNGYRTVDADEHFELARQRVVPERTIHLTFDDGWASLSQVAYPLLRRFGFRASSFIIPGLIGERDRIHPRPEGNGEPLCSWNEIAEMHRSGTIDFQSHTMFHRSAAHWPTVHPLRDDLPIPHGLPEMTLEEDLRAAREKIERRLSGKAVRHLAWVNFEGTAAAEIAARAAGYWSTYWGLNGRQQSSGAPLRIRRLPAHYLFRLPGVGRQPLRSLLAERCAEHGPAFIRKILASVLPSR
jgi:peptidoglycan/xylan/chitin deacetylase (PgdA/CDA1 family)